jgi:SAM-dependent methyltransferase
VVSLVDTPYDWDDYRSDFIPSEAYRLQEVALETLLSALPPPATVLEVGPGFGRVTKILTQLWPKAKFALADLSEAAIEQTSAACPEVDFSMAVGRLQDDRLFPPATFDLVVAIEVLLHIPPGAATAQRAVNNTLSYLKPKTGVLITCDWTQPLPEAVPIRRDNFCHDYPTLFDHARPAAILVSATPVGLQTIYLVKRTH